MPEGFVLFVGELLVAEEDDEVLHQRVVHLVELLIAERPRQIDPGNLGADMRRQLFDLDRLVRHRCSSGPRLCRTISRLWVYSRATPTIMPGCGRSGPGCRPPAYPLAGRG